MSKDVHMHFYNNKPFMKITAGTAKQRGKQITDSRNRCCSGQTEKKNTVKM